MAYLNRGIRVSTHRTRPGKLLAAAWLALLLALPAFGWFGAGDVQAADQPQVVRVGLYDNKPKLWRDEAGRAQGLFPDTINAIAKMEGWKVEYVFGTWDEGLARLADHEIDIMPDVAWSEERGKQYDFNNETVLVSWGVFYTRAGFSLESLKDLEGKRIAVMKSGILYDGPLGLKNLLDSFGIKAEIVDVTEYADVFNKLDTGEADVGVVNRSFGAANDQEYDVKRTSLIFYPSELKFALTKGSKENAYLIERIDADLHWLKDNNDSEYHRSLQRYFGGVIEEVEVFPRWLKVSAEGLGVVLALILTYVLVLHIARRRLETLVRAKTADLVKEKEQFKSIFYGSNDALALFNLSDLKVIECNEATRKLLGYAKKEHIIGRPAADFSGAVQTDGQPTAEAIAELVAKVKAKGGATREWVNRRANGAEIITLITLTPVRWEGRPALYVSLNDISRRKKAEDALAKSEGQYRLLIENIWDIVYSLDPRGTITFVSQQVTRYGWDRKDLVGKSFTDFVAPEDRALIGDHYRKLVMMGVETPVTARFLSKDGREIWTEATSRLQRDEAGRITGSFGIFRDITDRKRAELDLNLKNIILSTQQETSLDGILVVGKKREILSYNRRFIEIWGIPPEVVTTKSDELALKYVTDKLTDPQEFMKKVENLYEHPDAVSREEVALRDGRTLDRYSAPMIGRDRTNYGRVWYFQDITDRKRAEEMSRSLDMLKNNFIQTVSHQLRTPLGAIRWTLEQLLDKTSGRLTKGQREMTEMALESDIKVVATINDLLTAMDIKEGRVRLEKHSAVFEDIVHSACLENSPRFEAKGLRHVHEHPADQATTLDIDTTRIRDVVDRLLDNAISYTKPGGTITSRIVATDKTVRFTVTDTGIGVPKDDLAYIFECFNRGSNASKMKPDAIGLGLYIAKSYVEAHGGTIGVESKEGKGSTFWFELPRANRRRPAARHG